MKSKIIVIFSLIVSFIGNAQTSLHTYKDKSATVELSNQTFTHDTIIDVEKIICRTGGKIRILNGANVTLIAQVLQVDFPNYVIDGRGNAGVNGADVINDWTSTPGFPGFNSHDGHAQWLSAGGAVDVGGAGKNGGNGATVLIRYRIFQCVNGNQSNINCLTAGGKGGAGGRGRKLICGNHPTEIKYGNSGAYGIDGINGNFNIIQVP